MGLIIPVLGCNLFHILSSAVLDSHDECYNRKKFLFQLKFRICRVYRVLFHPDISTHWIYILQKSQSVPDQQLFLKFPFWAAINQLSVSSRASFSKATFIKLTRMSYMNIFHLQMFACRLQFRRWARAGYQSMYYLVWDLDTSNQVFIGQCHMETPSVITY